MVALQPVFLLVVNPDCLQLGGSFSSNSSIMAGGLPAARAGGGGNEAGSGCDVVVVLCCVALSDAAAEAVCDLTHLPNQWRYYGGEL